VFFSAIHNEALKDFRLRNAVSTEIVQKGVKIFVLNIDPFTSLRGTYSRVYQMADEKRVFLLYNHNKLFKALKHLQQNQTAKGIYL